MKIYLAGVNMAILIKTIQESKCKNILISYADYRNTYPKYRESFKGLNIILDSGAFTAFTQNKKYDIDEYIDFIKTYGGDFEYYFNLDVIGDFHGTWDNQEYMESQGLNPVPVFHYGEPEELMRFLVKQYKMIGIGGTVPIPNNKIDKWLNHLFFNKDGELKYPDTMFHGLGITSPHLLRRYPFYSVDSSQWLVAKRFGVVINGEGVRVRMDDKTVVEKLKHNIDWHLSLENSLKGRTFTPQQRLF